MTYKRVDKDRPANTDAYIAGDVIGSAGADGATWTFDEQFLESPEILLTNLQLIIHASSVPVGMGGFKQYFFKDRPSDLADNAPFTLTSAIDKAAYSGLFAQYGTPVLTGAGLLVASFQGFNNAIGVSALAGAFVYYSRLVTDAGYTPVSETKYSLENHGISVGR